MAPLREDFEEQADLCGIASAYFWFMFAILCLWWATMLKVMRNNE